MSSEGPAKGTMLKESEFTRWAERFLEEYSEMSTKDIKAMDYGKPQEALRNKA